MYLYNLTLSRPSCITVSIPFCPPTTFFEPFTVPITPAARSPSLDHTSQLWDRYYGWNIWVAVPPLLWLALQLGALLPLAARQTPTSLLPTSILNTFLWPFPERNTPTLFMYLSSARSPATSLLPKSKSLSSPAAACWNSSVLTTSAASRSFIPPKPLAKSAPCAPSAFLGQIKITSSRVQIPAASSSSSLTLLPGASSSSTKRLLESLAAEG
jgi:hypothetical protein